MLINDWHACSSYTIRKHVNVGILTTIILYIQPVLTCFIFDLPTHWDKMINIATHVKLEIVMLHSSSLVAS